MKQTFNFTKKEVLDLLLNAVSEANPHLVGKSAHARIEYSANTDWKLRFTVDVE